MTAYSMRTGLSNRMIGDPERKRVLIVDDEDTIRLALARFLQTRGYDVDTASSGAAALDQVTPGHYAVMICDVRMPGMTGLELLPQVTERDPDLGIMMLTAVNDAPTAAESLSLGAMEYLMKPIELGELQLAVERVLHRRNFALERRNVERIIRDEVDRRTVTLRQDRQMALEAAFQPVILAVVAFETKDPYFVGMSDRVAALAYEIAANVGLAAERCERIALAGRIHDVGRLALRDAILGKAGPLTADEFEHIKEHVPRSLEILAPLPQHSDVLDAVADHHEHWNGTGYPRGVSGKAISIGGRILCAADAFVALTSMRPHRGALSPDETVAYLTTQAGTLLDPDVFESLSAVVTGRPVPA